jgi:hypothetical protein
MKSKSNKDIDDRIDNGLKKKEMEEKFGAKFGSIGDISPEIEKEWLKSIEAFEEQYRNSKRVSVWAKIGKPEFKKIEDLQADEVSIELERLFDILGKNHVSLNTLCKVEDRELYRFITEELFVHMINDIKIEGMISCFTYEEFHPNARLNIEHAFDYFFRFTMAKGKRIGCEDGYDMLYIDTDNYEDINGKILEKEKVKKTISNFLNSFDRFEIISIEIQSCEINKEENDALIKFFIHYRGLFDNSNELVEFKGNAAFKFRPGVYGGWEIYNIDLPGLKIN